jgi:adenylate kinase family enzyme
VARRIVVVGISGNGKTTLSRRLSEKLDVPHVELDRFQHQPGWVQATDEELRRDVDAAVQRSDGWVIDGSYTAVLGDLVLPHADTLVWLDQPLPLVLTRLFRRAIRDIVTERDLFNGNRQTFRYAFFVRDSLISWAIKMHFRRRRTWPDFFASFPNVEVVRLRSPRAVERWFGCQAPD